MKFYKIVLAAFIGTLIALVINFFIKVGVVSSMISSLSKNEAETSATVKPNSVLYMKLNYAIADRTTDNPFSGLDFQSMESKDMTGMNDILRNIEQAKTDPNIKGIYMDLSSIPTSTATLQEIRNKLIKFKESGKFIVTYSETYSQSAYYMASVADKIFLNPEGALDLHGMASQVMFYKHLLDKLDIEMQIVRGPNNRFKSAVEPYFLDKMSEANREQMDKLLGSVWGQILTGISQSRNISVEQLNQIADNLETIFNADKALEYGLVDNLYYKDQVLDELKGLTGSNKNINAIGNAKYAKSYKDKNMSKNEVAVIYASGQIFDGKGDETANIYSDNLSKTIRKAREDENVKAIVLRVNSPGGSAVASAIIGRELDLTKEVKPVIVSMGNYAASGGYWISAKGDYIFADPTTLTGSIGVFGTFPNAKGFLNDKIGLTFDVAKTNENADFGSITQPLTEFQYAKLQENVVKTYDQFTKRVAEGRGLRQTYVDSIGQGRVWSGADAIGLGLVDQLGDMEDAIAYAAAKANLGSDYKVTEMPKKKDFMSRLMESISSSNADKLDAAMRMKLGAYYDYLQGIENLQKNTGIQARMPFDMIIE
ncbi:MAG: signal peptide peptidase SppA [Bacteroidales bacterium]|nr:signal peptide peptidase SppA [Bacteroidales bacterium]MBQ8959579.1 signal peptide peptidase SppA [Bacteroidales bacterium]